MGASFQELVHRQDCSIESCRIDRALRQPELMLHVLLYNPSLLDRDPLAILRVWEGGVSFHGGLIGAALAGAAFSRRRNLPLLSLMDLIAASVPFGLFFGRLANFVNGELWGAPSDMPWANVPGGGPVDRHPSELYETALEGLLMLVLLWLLTHRLGVLRRAPVATGAFMLLYGLFRIFVEFFRMPDAAIGYLLGTEWVTMVLSLPLLAIGVILTAWGWSGRCPVPSRWTG